MENLSLPNLSEWKDNGNSLSTEIKYDTRDSYYSIINMINKFVSNHPIYYICSINTNQKLIKVCKLKTSEQNV